MTLRALAATAALMLAAPAMAEPVIVTGAATRLRAQPSTDAPEVGRLPLGATVEAGATSGAGADAWRQVSAGATQGWLSARFTAPFNPAARDSAFLALARARLAVEKPTFGDAVELVQFLNRASTEATGRDARAELSLDALLALQASLAAISFEQREAPAFKAWTDAQADRIVYSEPSGEWYVRADAMWALAKAYRDTRLGEPIAYEASKIPLPGECEGDMGCEVSYLGSTQGEYLARYPRGAHAAAILKDLQQNLDQMLADVGQYDDGGDRAERLNDFHTASAGLRKTLPSVAGGARAVATLDAIEARMRPPK